MLKKLLVFIVALYTTLAMAAIDAIDANKASTQELTAIKGIGPATAARIIEARQQSPFKNWDDFIARIKGVAPASAAKLSEAGLTINGQAYKPSQPTSKAVNKPAEKTANPSQNAGKKPEKS